MASLATTDYASYIITLGGATLFQLKCDASPIENHNTETLFSIKQNNQGVVSSSFAKSFNASHGEKQELESMLPHLYDDGDGPMMIWKGVVQRALGIAIPKRGLDDDNPAYSTEEKKRGILEAFGIQPKLKKPSGNNGADRLILKNICAEQTCTDVDMIDISGTVLSSHADAGGGLQEIIRIVRDTLTIINPDLGDLEISTKECANHFHIFKKKRARVAFNNIQAKIELTFGTKPSPSFVNQRWNKQKVRLDDHGENSAGSSSSFNQGMSKTKSDSEMGSGQNLFGGPPREHVLLKRKMDMLKKASPEEYYSDGTRKHNKKKGKGGGRKTRRKRRYSKRKTKRKTRRKTKRKTRRKTIRKKRKTRKR
tara:strand:+ start:21 stop:1121 length:1101 start_codon:yes stop_codon:yes gene_type:complete